MLVFSSSHVRLIPPSWFWKVSIQFHATPWSREDAYPVFFSSSSNRFPSVLNFSSHWARNILNFAFSPSNGWESRSFGWLVCDGLSHANRSVCNISVVNRWGLSVILLGCSGDSGVCALDLCSGVTGLGARWSSGTSLNSLRLRGSLVFSSRESTLSCVAMSDVDGGDAI